MGQKCLSAHVPLGRYAMNKGAKISLRYRFKRHSLLFPHLQPGCGQAPDFGEKNSRISTALLAAALCDGYFSNTAKMLFANMGIAALKMAVFVC